MIKLFQTSKLKSLFQTVYLKNVVCKQAMKGLCLD